MSSEQLKAFLEAVKADAGLQAKLKASTEADVLTIAKAAGFMISADDLKKAEAQISDDVTEISDEELEAVAGGGGCWFLSMAQRPEFNDGYDGPE